jgi:DNA-binding HxlR family transcriptional regulator
MRLVDLRRECGSPAQTTLRAHLRELEGTGAIAKQRRSRFPGALEYELLPPGDELLFVAKALERWLQRAPDKELPFPGEEAKSAIKALADAWASTMLRALAASPLSLTELDGVISALNYPSLERRLSAMRLTGQVEPCPGRGSGTPYRVTDWLRRGVAPLTAAARWERRHLRDDTMPISRIDAETAFLLTLPLLRLPAEWSGSCRMGVEMTNGQKRGLVGATAYVERGRISSCSVRLENNTDAWATGSVAAWLDALISCDLDRLELGGDQALARSLVTSLQRTLFDGSKTNAGGRKT